MDSRFAIDSSVYIEALRDRARLLDLKGFLGRAGLRVLVAGVVALELRAGARTEPQAAALNSLLDPYVQRDRMFGVSFDAFWQAGRVLCALAPRGTRGEFPRHLTHDAMLAASCRETRVTLITRNARDFARVQRYLRGFRFTQPWPA